MRRRTTAVIGGGCSGALVVLRLLRCSDDDVFLVEPGTPGAGVAYGAAKPCHLLNSRAGKMSADPDDPGHFVTWLRGRGIDAGPESFLPRRQFGRYLFANLDAAACAFPGRLRLFAARATRVVPGDDGVLIALDDGRRLRVDRAVLATGGPGTATPLAVGLPARNHPAYVNDPWAPGALDRVGTHSPVLLLGTGLTAVDVAATLAATGRPGPVVAVSRRGLLPQAHVDTAEPAVSLAYAADLPALTRQVRAAARDTDWRRVVDGLRPHLDTIWSGLGPAGQDRFLRHLSRHWETHRHRMAPAIAARVAAWREAGWLRVRAGHVVSVVPDGEALAVTLADRTGQRFGAVVNCTGPGRLPADADPLVAALLADGLVRSGPHGLGLDTDAHGRLRDARGAVHQTLWTVGPLRRGTLWETTAVPEIRAQVSRLVDDLAAIPVRPVAVRQDQLAA